MSVSQVALEGDDVVDERERVAALPAGGGGDAIVVRGLRKVYPAQVAAGSWKLQWRWR